MKHELQVENEGLHAVEVAVLDDAGAGHPLAVQVGDALELDEEAHVFDHLPQPFWEARDQAGYRVV